MAVLKRTFPWWPMSGPSHWRSLCLCVVALAMWPTLRAQPAAPSREYQLKAVFVFNFAVFVDWPPRSFADAQAPLVIGILGEDPFGEFLDSLVKGEKAQEHPLIVRRFKRVEEIDVCHVLFVSTSEAEKVPAILKALKGRSILTVSDIEDFTLSGGMVRFLTEKGKIRLRINLDEAKHAELTLSSKLLRPAEIVATRVN
jgi:hypothetical protein